MKRWRWHHQPQRRARPPPASPFPALSCLLSRLREFTHNYFPALLSSRSIEGPGNIQTFLYPLSLSPLLIERDSYFPALLYLFSLQRGSTIYAHLCLLSPPPKKRLQLILLMSSSFNLHQSKEPFAHSGFTPILTGWGGRGGC